MLEVFQPIVEFSAPVPGADGAWVWRSRAKEFGTVMLSDAEHVRIARLLSANGRGLLAASLQGRRYLLSQLLGKDASQIRIVHDTQGKPGLPDFPGVSVSFSDSEGWNALALSRAGAVGVDVEFVRPLSWEPMLNMLSEEDEARTIHAVMTGSTGGDTFFRCWTAKEAILKAAGTGLKGGARRIRLPGQFVTCQTDQFSIKHDGLSLIVETHRTEQTIVSRAVAG
ncbi:4'-phosphopantetheinyl transferase superfamily protein [uncultured Hyphomonas sp.]|uniref:4'-phosphopantetheinyl transferase family protein n=1 Tax=uncultured Hyphomonas sp. TaxID=225298 RepID=UPI002AAB533C|nr:4'-phosphopantetheinyl transferase superfamily protein [uncultured Hyphomonas sp.]